MKDYQQAKKEKIMAYIKNKGIQMAINIPSDCREEVMLLIKGKGEGEVSDETLSYLVAGYEVLEEPVKGPAIEEPVVKEKFEEGKVEEQPKPKNKKKNKNELS